MSNAHTVLELSVNILWFTKYRYIVLDGDIKEGLCISDYIFLLRELHFIFSPYSFQTLGIHISSKELLHPPSSSSASRTYSDGSDTPYYW